MAKKTKKKIQSEEVVPAAPATPVPAVAPADTKPPIGDNEFSFCLTAHEMLSMVQILAFSKDVFEQMAANCVKEGDVKTAETYAARSALSLTLYEKIRDVASIGEPTSRNVH